MSIPVSQFIPLSFSSQYSYICSVHLCLYICFANKFICTIFLDSTAAMSLQLCLTLCNLIDSSPPGSPVPGILQARILEWVAVPSSRGSSWPRDWTQGSCISCTAGEFFTRWVTWEALSILYIESVVCVCQSQSLNSAHPLFPSWYP